MQFDNVPDACFVRPETCTDGATLSAWIKVDNCDPSNGDGIMTSYERISTHSRNCYSTGFNVRCHGVNNMESIRYVLGLCRAGVTVKREHHNKQYLGYIWRVIRGRKFEIMVTFSYLI